MELNARVDHCGASSQRASISDLLPCKAVHGVERFRAAFLPKSGRHAWLSSFLPWKWCWIRIRWSCCLLLFCNFTREGDCPGRGNYPWPSHLCWRWSLALSHGALICAPGTGAPDKQADTSIALMPERGTTLIKWSCLKLRQKSWGSDSLFSYDITLLAGVLSPFLWTNLPLAAAVLWLQTTEISLTSAFKALCKNKLGGRSGGEWGQKELPLYGLPLWKEWIFSVLSPARPLALSSCVCLIKVENVTTQLSIACFLRSI